MAEQELNEQMTENVPNAEDQLAEVMKNMVPRSELDKAKNDYNRLYNKILSGEFGNQPAPENAEPDLAELAKAAVEDYRKGSGNSVCKMFENCLAVDNFELSKARRSGFEASEGDRDINGARDSADRTRQLIEYALEEANGDDNLFIARLQNHLRDR